MTSRNPHEVIGQTLLMSLPWQALIDLRARDVIGDAAFQSAEEELDLLELTADPRIRSG